MDTVLVVRRREATPLKKRRYHDNNNKQNHYGCSIMTQGRLLFAILLCLYHPFRDRSIGSSSFTTAFHHATTTTTTTASIRSNSRRWPSGSCSTLQQGKQAIQQFDTATITGSIHHYDRNNILRYRSRRRETELMMTKANNNVQQEAKKEDNHTHNNIGATSSSTSSSATTSKHNNTTSVVDNDDDDDSCTDATATLSNTKLKLKPSYELFPMLPPGEDEDDEDDEQGSSSQTTTTTIPSKNLPPSPTQENGNNDSLDDGDDLRGLQLSDYISIGNSSSNTNNNLYRTKKKQRLMERLPDPYRLVEKELRPFSNTINELVSDTTAANNNPILAMAAQNFLENRRDKRFRPTLLGCMAKAVLPVTQQQHEENNKDKDDDAWRRQGQLGQIVEMIHVASLIHDKVLNDDDPTNAQQQQQQQQQILYSNKIAVLAGDYLLARASVLLARLENRDVVQMIATALESIVSGDIMMIQQEQQQQQKPSSTNSTSSSTSSNDNRNSSLSSSRLGLETYVKTSYYKTASLIAYACRSTALLGGHDYGSAAAITCEEFGFHLGLAYQIQKDLMDFRTTGTSTNPLRLQQWTTTTNNQNNNNNNNPNPVTTTTQPMVSLYAVQKSRETAMVQTKSLAMFHGQRAIDALLRLPPSEARNALVRITIGLFR